MAALAHARLALAGLALAVLPAWGSPPAAEQDRPVSFRRQVMAVLGVSGCNSGSCHGLPSGRGGFRLSLWGQDPAADYLQLTRDALGRRTDRLDPGSSLILQKALGRVPHEGGRRFAPDGTEARLLRDWVTGGLRDDPPDLPALTGITVEPGACLLHAPACRQQLTVIAAFADGTTRDVTRLTVFGSSEPAVAAVSPAGLVEFRRGGEVAVLCRYLDQMRSVHLTCLRPAEGFRWPDPPENNYVDRQAFAKLKLLGIAPSEPCTDEEFVRRVYLDVCGILPTAAEARGFLANQHKDRRARLIEALLARPEYADFWTLKWADVLRVKKTFLQPQGARAYHAWLRDAVRNNTPLDQVVRALLTSQGHSYKVGPANYYCVVRPPRNEGELIQHDLAESTAQLFLGVRMQCAKCHNHPFERWTQDDYWGLAAFFAQVKVQREGNGPGVGNPDHRPASVALDPKAPELVQPRSGKPVPPRFLGGPAPPIPPGKDRRAVLAEWLTRPDNRFFARSVVNRLWFHLNGRGIVEPVDDARASNPPANDQLLEALAADFVGHHFDVKHVLRVILNSRTYQLSARAGAFNQEDTRYFSHAVVKPLTAEQLLDALCTATGVPERYEGYPLGTRAAQLPDGEVLTNPGRYLGYDRHPFMKAFGQPARELACECARETEFGLGQALELLNGPTLSAKLRDPNNCLGQLLEKQRADAEVLDTLYFTALSRPPSRSAARALVGYVARAGDKRKAWEDVLWTLLRSQEFTHRH
jgi:hypothetical protein